MDLTVINSGTGSLVKAVVVPFARENLTVAGTMVRTMVSGAVRQTIGPRLRSQHLISLPPGTTTLQAAAKDTNGLWSEWSLPVDISAGNFSPGSNEASIGQGFDGEDDLNLQEPAVAFPELSLGSGQGMVHRTIISDGFYDEVRRTKWVRSRATFRVVLNDLEQEQTLLLHRWFRALNGAFKPFTFTFTDPQTGETKDYVVRFRDPQFAEELFDVDRSSTEFTLIELLDLAEGDVA